MVVVVVVLVLVVVVVGGGVILGEVKARPKDIISFSLDYYKQKQSTDKQSVIKPHSTRHAGKAGGFIYHYFVIRIKIKNILVYIYTYRNIHYGKVP